MATAMKIDLPDIELSRADIGIMGRTPLIVHAWNPKAKEEMLLKQMKQPFSRETKNPVDAFMRSMYRTDDGYYGIPAVGIKNAMVTACTSVEGITKTAARQAFIVLGERGRAKAAFADLHSPVDLVRIVSPNPPAMREDMVRLAGVGNTADLRYRPEFWPWGAKVSILYNENVLELKQLLNLLNTAGFGVGLCEWRPERNGQNGTFRVATEADNRMLESDEWQTHQEPLVPDTDAWLRDTASGIEVQEVPVRPARAKRGRPRKRFEIPEAAIDPLFGSEAANDPVFEAPQPPPRRRRTFQAR